MAEQNKITSVPLTVSVDGEKGPKPYKLDKDTTFTIVVYDAEKKVTATFSFEKLDAKSQDEALAAFAKVLGVEAPKSAGSDKKDDASDKKDAKSEKSDKKDEGKKEPD
jgi:hypothetical protein